VVTYKKTLSTKKKKPAKSNRALLKWIVVLAGLAALIFLPHYYGRVIKSATSTWRWARDAGVAPKYHVYKSFRIPIPDGYTLHGIDVSYYQGKIDWQRVKKMHEDSVRVDFAFMKATEGLAITDPYFQRNWRECQKAGITCGAYHYFRPKQSGEWQARFLLQNVKLKKGNLPIVADVEGLDGTAPDEMRKQLSLFLTEVAKSTGAKPIIYSGLSFYQDNLRGYFDDYPFWLSNFSHPEASVNPGINWKFWQHSERARVSGVISICDFDVFKGDSAAFGKLLIK
jgi:lysozyme